MSTRPGPYRIRVLCVDDHRLVRDGIASLIRVEPDMEIVGLASSGEEAISMYRSLKPDVTLMDLQLPRLTGAEAIRAIRRDDEHARIIIVTMHQGEEDVYRAIAAGATAYLLKDALPEDLSDTIRRVFAGEQIFLPPEVEARLASRTNRPALTRREIEIVELIGKGMRNKEIAAVLGISEETVHVHLRRIYSKLEVNDRSAVVPVAIRRGIIHLK